MSEKFFVGLDVTGFENTGKYRPISRVTLWVDDSNCLTAGDDTGLEVEADCPHATQAMVNALLAQLQGYQYQSFSADAANLDPAAELGDGVTVSGVYSTLSRLSDDGNGFPDISAPGEVALEEEYPSAGPMTQEFNRQIAETRSTISKTSEQILLQVENEINGLSASIDLQLDSITSTVQGQAGQISSIQQTVSSITQQITGINGDITSIEQYVDSITLSVSNGSTSSTISLKAGSTTIASQTIEMNGLVTFTGLSNGTTTINGACIKTGYISANRLDLTGAITFSDLSTSVQNDINDAYSMAQDAEALASDVDDVVGSWSYRYNGKTYIDGTMLKTGTVMASDLLGGTVGLLDEDERTVGGIEITYTTTGYGLNIYTNRGGMLMTSDGNWWVDANYGSLGITSSGVVCEADCVPQRNDYYSLGAGGLTWSDCYVASGTITTSDRNKKNTITYNMAPYEALFDALRPTPYKLNNGTSGRTHLGLISQDVEEALTACGLTDMDFAGFIKSPAVDETKQETGEYNYALRYGEFIAMLIHEVQMLKARVAELEAA